MIKMYAYGEVPNSEIFARDSSGPDVAGTVAEIIARVAAEGDAALLEYTRRFDHAELSSLAVTPGELEEAMGAVEPEFLEVLREAAANIRAFHEKQFILETAVAAETDKLLTLQRQSTEMRANMKNRANRYEHEPDRHTGNDADAPNAPGNQDAPSGTGNPEA